ncbi:hypothetical protein Golob_027718 [Gossypium lobatum]|uniref:Uncharacterized protein n=1 Tax=Gossypium lobatum TaxID=34289 RepID=A0A7J8NEB9_9ROSI|nr:hypothetical protein [Gossypium lobatum]
MKRLTIGPMVASEYNEWWNKRVNDNIPKLREEDVRPIEEYLQVIQFEIEIIKQDFEKRNLKKGKNKAEEDLDGLKADYKKLSRSIRTTDLDVRAKEVTLEKSLLECQNKKAGLKARITELEKLLR